MTNVKVTPPRNPVNKIHDFEEYKPEWLDLNAVIPKAQPWMWSGVIPNETTTLLAGYGGIGKSTFLTYLAAHVSNGKAFKCCGQDVLLEQGGVILLSAEDREDTHIVPNLLAVDAVISNIHHIKSTVGVTSKERKFLNLDKELYILENKVIEQKNIRLIIIDPVSYFTGEVRDHIQTEVANFIQRLSDLARKYSLVVIISKHMRKKSGKQSLATAVDEVGGSSAWVNTPRQAFAFMKHPVDKEKILIFNMKTNIGKQRYDAICYKIEQVNVSYESHIISSTKLVWMDKLESISIDDAVNVDSFDKSKARQASDIIYDYLYENGVTSSITLKSVCLKSGISERTCQRTWLQMEKEGTIRRAKGNIKTHFELTDGWKGEQ